MLFSSNIFLFFFLPGVLFVYYVLFRRSRLLQNCFLFLASLFFYAWGEPKFVLVMILSIFLNWLLGIAVGNRKAAADTTGAKIFLAIAVVLNLVIIFIFKYLMFALNNINALFHTSITVPEIALPIGISFFTFQAISYVVDVYRGTAGQQKSIINVGLYISLFPQLIAGPIVRYETIADQINNRKETLDDFCAGVVRFLIGLCKKIIIANNVAVVADYAFSAGQDGELSIGMAWLGAIAYTLQIYYDFSGYSDMAIGLGGMFGFKFLENFNYPYISSSATEFWRRWHMSLGTWFRDYVYIPLGGSRTKTVSRHIFNLFIVWLCTGIWHGANWTFILWGLLYFVLLVFEKYSGFRTWDSAFAKGVKHIYLLFFVIAGWVLFRADNLAAAADYYCSMFGLSTNTLSDDSFIEYITQYAVYLGAGIIFSMPLFPAIRRRFKDSVPYNIGFAAALLALFLVAVSFLVKSSYNPFIYFNF